MKVSKRKQKILELEAELRIIRNVFYKRSGERNKVIIRELEEISLKWKIKKYYRRFISWQKSN